MGLTHPIIQSEVGSEIKLTLVSLEFCAGTDKSRRNTNGAKANLLRHGPRKGRYLSLGLASEERIASLFKAPHLAKFLIIYVWSNFQTMMKRSQLGRLPFNARFSPLF